MEQIGKAVSRIIDQQQQKPASSTQPQQSVNSTDEVCPICGGWGRHYLDVSTDDARYGKLVPCINCGAELRQKYLLRLSRLSSDMQQWRLASFRARGKLGGVVQQIRQALEMGMGWLTLSGPPGTGKTYLLAAIANEARLMNKTAVYTTTAELLDDLRDSFHPDSGDKFSTLFTNVLEADVLCLDELEKFSTTQWAEEKFFRLIEHRYRHWNEGLTVIATNNRIGPDDVVVPDTRYPNYLESRIRDGRFWRFDEFWQLSDARPALRRGQ